jgi:hypothetical protein
MQLEFSEFLSRTSHILSVKSHKNIRPNPEPGFVLTPTLGGPNYAPTSAPPLRRAATGSVFDHVPRLAGDRRHLLQRLLYPLFPASGHAGAVNGREAMRDA